MNLIEVTLQDGYTSFRPGDVVEGTVMWQLDPPPDVVDARLFWFTRGKGTRDVIIVETIRYHGPVRMERRAFRFQLPAGPYSFSGKLISLVWAIEVVAEPGDTSGRAEFTVSPTGDEILLGTP